MLKPVIKSIEIEGPGLDDSSDTTLVAFIEELTKVLEIIPEAYKHVASISVYADYNINTYIKYTRPETDEEKNNRFVLESSARYANEIREKEQLARLKAKYEA